MNTKTKRALVVVGGAGAAYLLFARPATGAGTFIGDGGTPGKTLVPAELLENPIETITEVIAPIVAPFTTSEPYIGSKKFTADVDKGIFGDVEFYNVDTVGVAEQLRRRAEIMASKPHGSAVVAPWDVMGAGTLAGSKKSRSSSGGGTYPSGWSGASTPPSYKKQMSSHRSSVQKFNNAVKKYKSSQKTTKKTYSDGRGGRTSKPGQPD